MTDPFPMLYIGPPVAVMHVARIDWKESPKDDPKLFNALIQRPMLKPSPRDTPQPNPRG